MDRADNAGGSRVAWFAAGALAAVAALALFLFADGFFDVEADPQPPRTIIEGT